jgi:hypothetical protein
MALTNFGALEGVLKILRFVLFASSDRYGLGRIFYMDI